MVTIVVDAVLADVVQIQDAAAMDVESAMDADATAAADATVDADATADVVPAAAIGMDADAATTLQPAVLSVPVTAKVSRTVIKTASQMVPAPTCLCRLTAV